MPIIEQNRRKSFKPPSADVCDVLPLREVDAERPLYVMKFGGTSVGTAQSIEKISDIVVQQYREGKSVVVVVSAMSGITNTLLELSSEDTSLADREKILRSIMERHSLTISDLRLYPERRHALRMEVNNLFRLLRGDIEDLNLTGMERRDRILSYGERLSSRLVSTRLLERGLLSHSVDSTNLIITNESFGEATPDQEETEKRTNAFLAPMIKKNFVPVVTGFLGSTKDGRFTTLGRGGSDFSASYIGSILHAQEVWIWTDVDGVFDKDPQLHPDAFIYEKLSFQEADRMAKEGAKVLHNKTLEPLYGQNIILRVKNTFNPAFPGTEIVPQEYVAK